jgi:hypothetical protein
MAHPLHPAWSRARIVAAIRRFTTVEGRLPTRQDCVHRRQGLPHPDTINRWFQGGLAEAIRSAAGLGAPGREAGTGRTGRARD